MDNQIKILLLEDNPSDVELIKHELRRAGLNFTTLWAADKQSFLERLETFFPDIVLLDILR